MSTEGTETKHLWEIDHPYYGPDGYSNQAVSFAELRQMIDQLDEDMNHHFNGFRPGVIRRTDDLPPERHHYQIRVQVGYYEAWGEITRKYDSFTIALDGEVLSAPRGWAKDYKPARVTGLDDAVAKYAEPASTERSA